MLSAIKIFILFDHNFGPSGVRALLLAAGINVGGHYKWHFGPREVRATSGAT